jgi:hypothetical protein
MTRRKPGQPPKETKTQNNKAPKALTDMMELFVKEYVVDLNAREAATRAGYSAKTAHAQAARLLTYPIIQQAIEAEIAKRNARLEVDQDRIVRELWNVAMADANGLVQFRRTCCRYCYGEGHRYQRTAGEMERAEIEHRAGVLKAEADGIKLSERDQTFDRRGGIGYDPRKAPADDCPECFGEGEGRVFVADTRNLPPELRSLYAGIKQTKEGLEVKTHDKKGFTELLMRHVGMLNDKLKLQGDKENPLTLLIQSLQGSALKPAGPEPEDDD